MRKFLSALLLSSLLVSPAVAQNTGSGGGSAAATIVQNQLVGLTLSNDVGTPNTKIDVAAGQAADGTNATLLVAGALVKTTGAFVAGTGNGCLDTGAVGNSSWYHIWLISKAAGANPDILCSLSATAPTMPSTYTLKRRIGAIKTDGAAAIIGFTQVNDTFRWLVNVLDSNDTGGGTTANLVTLSTPAGIKTTALFHAISSNASAVGWLLTSPDDTDTAPDTTNQFNLFSTASAIVQGTDFQIRTNTASQIRRRSTAASATAFIIRTFGWIDDRGMGVN